MSKRYPIDKIEDILEIPPEKLDDFIVDLKGWYKMFKPLKILAKTTGRPDVFKLKKFTWIDDNKHDKTITITTKESKS